MRLGVRCSTLCISLIAVVSVAPAISAKLPLRSGRFSVNTPNHAQDGLGDFWRLFDAIAEKAYTEQEYRDSAGICLLSYLVGSALEDYEKSYTSVQRLAFCYHFLGDTEPALRAYRLALACAIPGVLVRLTAQKDDPGLAKLDIDQRVVRTLMNLGVLCVNARKLDSAETFFLRVIHLTQLEAPSTEVGKFRVEHLGARARTGLADICQDRGNYGQAIKFYEECREVFETEYRYLQLRERIRMNPSDRASMLAAAKSNLAHCLRNLGEAYLDSPTPKLAQAKARLEESLRLREEIGNNVLIADSEIALSELGIAEHKYADALQLAASAAGRTAPNAGGDNSDTYWQALLCQGKSLLELGRPAEAAVPLKTAIEVVEALKDPDVGTRENKAFFNSITWFFRQKVAPYIAMSEVCIRENQPEEALRYVELAKARTLLLGRPMDAVNQEESLGTISITPDELSRILAVTVPDQKTAALEYMFGADHGYVFLVTRRNSDDRPVVKVHAFEIKGPLPTPASNGDVLDLDSATTTFRNQLEKSYAGYPTKLAHSLYEVLVQPFEQELSTKESITVVPARNLWRIPFEALSSSETEGSYLVRNYAISYAPSLVFLARVIERANSDRRLTSLHSLVLTDPLATEGLTVPNNSDWRSFATAFGNQSGVFESRSFTGAEATRRCFLREAPGARLIVIATHAVAASNNPLESFFALSPEAGVNPSGHLTAADIMSEGLSANLAILTGCETEKGRFVEGEGEIGGGWAFLYAGCASTVVSQWKIDRDASFDLTARFCRGLAKRLQTPLPTTSLAELLRSTQLALLSDERYSHPFYWAGMVLVGDPYWRTTVANSGEASKDR